MIVKIKNAELCFLKFFVAVEILVPKLTAFCVVPARAETTGAVLGAVVAVGLALRADVVREPVVDAAARGAVRAVVAARADVVFCCADCCAGAPATARALRRAVAPHPSPQIVHIAIKITPNIRTYYPFPIYYY